MRNLYKFTKIYSATEPLLEEGDVFKTTVLLNTLANISARQEETRVENEETRVENEETRVENEETRVENEETRVENEETRVENEETRVENEKTKQKILDLLRQNPRNSTAELARKLSISEKGVEWQIKRLKDKNIIQHIGPKKGGYWEIIADLNGK